MATWGSRNFILIVVTLLIFCEKIDGQSTAVEFDAETVHSSEIKLKLDLSRSYNIDVLPPHNKTSPVKTLVGLNILAIKGLDFKQQILSTDCWLVLTWADSRLKWDKQLYSNIDIIRTDNKNIWKPDIKLYNSVHNKNDESVSDVYALVYNDGEVVWIPPVSLNSYCEMDIRYYPYDQHECMFKFGSWTHDGYHIQLELSLRDEAFTNVNNNDNAIQVTHDHMSNKEGEWEIVASRALETTVHYACCEEPYPDATFYVTLRRRSPFFKATVLCPVVAVVGLLLSTFWISPIASSRIIVSCVALLVSMANLISLKATLPPTGDLAPIVVTFTSSLTILSMIAIVTSGIFANICNTRRHDVLPRWIDVVLKTRIVAIIFCIAPTETFKRFTNQTDSETGNSHDDKQAREGAGINFQQTSRWIAVFQLGDRIAFVVCSIVLISILISLSV